MKVVDLLGIQQPFTAYSTLKGNADSEKWFRALKEDCTLLHAWESYK
jgi:hypothetical protein